MTNQTIPPCPACGVVPIMSIYQSENRIDGCKCIQWPIPCTQEYWGLWCDEAIGRHTRANLGITTIAQLNARLAPDPRVAFLDSLINQAKSISSSARYAAPEIQHIIFERAMGLVTQLIAAQRGEVAND